MTPLLVAVAGAVGVLARYYISSQAVLDVDAGEPGKALVYVVASVALGIAAAAAGYWLAHAVRH